MDDIPIQGPVFLIETNRITPNPHQPRRDFNETGLHELAESIREFGILQPIIVSKIEQETELGTQVKYQLIAGERRWRASQMVGLERIPAIIKNIQLERERLELAIVENIQRADLNAVEAARAYSRLQDEFGLTQREIASRLGKSREAIANTVRLLNLPSEVQNAIVRNQITESQGRLLLTVEDLAQQQMLFEELLRNNLSVRELKTRIQQVRTQRLGETPVAEIKPDDPEAIMIQKQLEEILGTSVKVEKSGPTGKITIAFYSPEELQALMTRLAFQPAQTNYEQPQENSNPENQPPTNYPQEGEFTI